MNHRIPIQAKTAPGRRKRAMWTPIEEHHTQLQQVERGQLAGLHRRSLVHA